MERHCLAPTLKPHGKKKEIVMKFYWGATKTHLRSAHLTAQLQYQFNQPSLDDANCEICHHAGAIARPDHVSMCF
jgi:hypothetical protein